MLVQSVKKDNDFNTVTDILLLKANDEVAFFDVTSKQILTGTISAFGDQIALERTRQVLLNEQIAVHDVSMAKNDQSNYIQALESKVKSLEKEKGNLELEVTTLKSQIVDLSSRCTGLVDIFNVVDEVRKGLKDTGDVNLTVILLLYLFCIKQICSMCTKGF